MNNKKELIETYYLVCNKSCKSTSGNRSIALGYLNSLTIFKFVILRLSTAAVAIVMRDWRLKE